jgi:hypothetical protein
MSQIIACATVIEKMLLLPLHGMAHQVLDLGLHCNPEVLHCVLFRI